MTDLALRVDGVGFAYPTREILRGIDLRIEPETLCCVVGRTGGGKTTLAKLLCGVLLPTDGRITIDGDPIAATKGLVSSVPQEMSLLPWLSLQRNVEIELSLNQASLSRRQRAERAREMLARVGLDGFEDYMPHQVSGGMKQRTAVARAFVSTASVLVMDEPFGALDVQTRYRLQEELLKLWQEDRRTIVFLTNDHDESLVLADRVIGIAGAPATVTGEMAMSIPRPRDPLDRDLLAQRHTLRSLLRRAEVPA